jgi:hypothetical protein
LLDIGGYAAIAIMWIREEFLLPMGDLWFYLKI